MRVSRPAAWFILVGAILLSGLLRHFSGGMWTRPFVPAPVCVFLFLLLVCLFVVIVRGWGRRQEVPYAGEGLSQVNLLAMVPLLIALLGEKWFSATFYIPAVRLGARAGLPSDMLGPFHEFLAGVGILFVSAALLPLFPRLWSLLRDFLSVRALAAGISGTVAALCVLYVAVCVTVLLIGGHDTYLYPRWFGSWAGLRFAGQALLALGEEIYYRGIIQTEIVFLMPALGVGRPATAAAMGVGLAGAQFALEHVSPGAGIAAGAVFLFSMLSAVLLGTLLVSLRSLYLCALAHFALNLFTLGGGIQVTDAAGRPLIASEMYVSLYLVALVLLVYSRFGPERQALARRRAQRLAGRAATP